MITARDLSIGMNLEKSKLHIKDFQSITNEMLTFLHIWPYFIFQILQPAQLDSVYSFPPQYRIKPSFYKGQLQFSFYAIIDIFKPLQQCAMFATPSLSLGRSITFIDNSRCLECNENIVILGQNEHVPHYTLSRHNVCFAWISNFNSFVTFKLMRLNMQIYFASFELQQMALI